MSTPVVWLDVSLGLAPVLLRECGKLRAQAIGSTGMLASLGGVAHVRQPEAGHARTLAPGPPAGSDAFHRRTCCLPEVSLDNALHWNRCRGDCTTPA